MATATYPLSFIGSDFNFSNKLVYVYEDNQGTHYRDVPISSRTKVTVKLQVDVSPGTAGSDVSLSDPAWYFESSLFGEQGYVDISGLTPPTIGALIAAGGAMTYTSTGAMGSGPTMHMLFAMTGCFFDSITGTVTLGTPSLRSTLSQRAGYFSAPGS